MVIGVVYEAALADASVWVVVSGRTLIKHTGGSTLNGRIELNAADGTGSSSGNPWIGVENPTTVGVWLETKSTGTTAWGIVNISPPHALP